MLRSKTRPGSASAAMGDFDVITGPPAPPLAQSKPVEPPLSAAGAPETSRPAPDSPPSAQK